MLVIVETHPVQYHAPVYREVARLGVPVKVVYGSDFSVVGYKDKEFGAEFAWDQDLLSGYDHEFLNSSASGKVINYDLVPKSGLEDCLNRLSPSVLLALGYSHVLDRATWSYAAAKKVPLLLRAEANDDARVRGRLKSWLRDIRLRWFYQGCSIALPIGSKSREHYLRLGIESSRLVDAPYCVPTGAFELGKEASVRLRRETRRRYGIAEDSLVVLYCGKLTERKGVDLIPAAIQRLPYQLRVRVVILWVGDGELRASLVKLNAMQVFAGFQNQSALSGFYHAADLVVLPSRAMETWGLVVNEALMHGCPVVVSDAVGCHPDLVGELTGAVAKAGCATSLAAAFVKVLNGRIESDACLRQVAPFSVDAAAAGVVHAYQRLMQ
jgi:glycosyltransferase involved in cell wall biosynthesis